MEQSHITALRTVALAFGELLPQVVFVGGATVGLYATALTVPEPRPTDDVDCIIDLASYAHFVELEEKLRQRGFRHDQTSGIQIRWRWQNTATAETYTVDIMPADGGAVLGSSVNRWYRNGLATSVRYAHPRTARKYSCSMRLISLLPSWKPCTTGPRTSGGVRIGRMLFTCWKPGTNFLVSFSRRPPCSGNSLLAASLS